MRALLVGVVAVASLAGPAGGAGSPIVVSFQRTGGFASIEKHLAVHRDGTISSDGYAAKKKLTAAKLAALRSALADARFATLDRVYEPDAPIADGYTYRITYAGRTVRIEEEATLPPRLQRVFTQLQNLTHG
jgi:hypothetical protein